MSGKTDANAPPAIALGFADSECLFEVLHIGWPLAHPDEELADIGDARKEMLTVVHID